MRCSLSSSTVSSRYLLQGAEALNCSRCHCLPQGAEALESSPLPLSLLIAERCHCHHHQSRRLSKLIPSLPLSYPLPGSPPTTDPTCHSLPPTLYLPFCCCHLPFLRRCCPPLPRLQECPPAHKSLAGVCWNSGHMTSMLLAPPF